MVVIRLSRTGTNKRPFYHVVVADRRSSRDGRYLERVGYYNPIAKGPEIYLHLEQERVTHWINQGAQPSDRVADLIKEFVKTGQRTGTEFNAQPTKRDLRRKKIKAAKKAAEAQAKAAKDAEANQQAAA